MQSRATGRTAGRKEEEKGGERVLSGMIVALVEFERERMGGLRSAVNEKNKKQGDEI